MFPIIGVTSPSDNIDRDKYVRALKEHGGLSVIFPNYSEKEHIQCCFSIIDGILLSGGADVNPLTFRENPVPGLRQIDPERDEFELAITRTALEKGTPVLAICRGMQVLNVAAGGLLYQDIYSQKKNILKHGQRAPRGAPSHGITIEPGTMLKDILGVESTYVNSMHHQAVKDIAPGFVVSARAPDGLPEGIEHTKHPFAVGVQWHPEEMWQNNKIFSCLFRKFVDACRKNRAGSE